MEADDVNQNVAFRFASDKIGRTSSLTKPISRITLLLLSPELPEGSTANRR